MTPVIEFQGIWPGFLDSTDVCNRSFVEELLAGLRWPSGTRVVRFCSMFGKKKCPHWKPADEVWISYSGEFEQWPDCGCFDLHLGGQEDGDRTVFLPLVVWYCHATGLWPRLVREGAPPAAKQFCCFVVTNPDGETRNRFYQRLQACYRPVQSYGRYRNNTGQFAPGTYWSEEYRMLLGRHKFALCFENNWDNRYITEKLVNAYAASCVPIYWGGASVCSWFNPSAFLSLPRAATEAQMDRLIEQIRLLDQNPADFQRVWQEPLFPGREPPRDMQLETVRRKIQSVLDRIPKRRRARVHLHPRLATACKRER